MGYEPRGSWSSWVELMCSRGRQTWRCIAGVASVTGCLLASCGWSGQVAPIEPQVLVTVPTGALSLVDVERRIMMPLGMELSRIKDVKAVSVVTGEGVVCVLIGFAGDRSARSAFADVAAAVNEMRRSFPASATEPDVVHVSDVDSSDWCSSWAVESVAR